jgi:hypothetical protein
MAKADAYDESFEKLIDNGKFSSVGMVIRSPSSYSNAVTMSPSAFAGYLVLGSHPSYSLLSTCLRRL